MNMRKIQVNLYVAAMVVVAWGASGGRCPAADAVENVLGAGFSRLPNSFERATEEYTLAKSSGAPSADLHYAMALVCLRHRRADAAQTLLDTAVTSDASHLPSWKAGFWLPLSKQDADGAYRRMQALAGYYPLDEVGADVEAALGDAAQWMGQLCGYLEGPGRKQAEDVAAAGKNRDLAAKLPPRHRARFDAGIRSIRDQYAQLQQDLDKKIAAASEHAAKTREMQTKVLLKEREEINLESATLESNMSKAQSEFESRLSEIDSQLKPLESELLEIKQKGDPIQKEIDRIEGQMAAVAGSVDGKDEGKLKQAQRRISQLQRRLNEQQRKLAPLKHEGEKIQAEAFRLMQGRAQLVAQAAKLGATMKAQMTRLAGNGKVIDNQLARLESEAGTLPPSLRAEQARLHALATYVPFPLEQEKERLLEKAD